MPAAENPVTAVMPTKTQLERELKTTSETVRYSERRVGWVALFVALVVWFVLFTGPISLGPALAMVIAAGFLTIQIWGIVASRGRIKVLNRALAQLTAAQATTVVATMPKQGRSAGVLGEFRWDGEVEGWVAEYGDGERTVRAVVDGGEHPDPVALVRAKDIFSRWPEYRACIMALLSAEAESYRRHGLHDEVMSLQIDEVGVSLKKDIDERYLVVYFEGPTDIRLWRMELKDKKLLHLGFDRQ